jgi:hypothetical protein
MKHTVFIVVFALAQGACSEETQLDSSAGAAGKGVVVIAGASGQAAGVAGALAPTGAAGRAMTPPAAPTPTSPPPTPAPAMPPTAAAGAPAVPPPPAPAPMMPATPAGPEDGDPSAPVIAVPDVACGPGRALGTGSVNVMIGGRGVFVAYPCDKHEGAPATVILNLHGTMPTEDIKLYQVGYFSAHTLVNSHNLIMVSPKAVGSQWGNGDGGADQPHLMEVIKWTYDTFKDFDIRALWVAGHSWGSAYTARFGCLPELADKVKGLILMSGGGTASCQSKVSVIISMAEGDGRMPTDQMANATAHGCGAAKKEMILMNDHTFWPDCMPGFVHANYYMLGKEHATFMDADVVKSIADWVKKARQ